MLYCKRCDKKVLKTTEKGRREGLYVHEDNSCRAACGILYLTASEVKESTTPGREIPQVKANIFQDYDPEITIKELSQINEKDVLFEWPESLLKMYNGNYQMGRLTTHTSREFCELCQDVDYYGYITDTKGNIILKIGNLLIAPVGDHRGLLGFVIENDYNQAGFSEFPLYKVSARVVNHKIDRGILRGLSLIDSNNISRLRIGSVLEFESTGLNEAEFTKYALVIDPSEVHIDLAVELASVENKKVARIFTDFD